MSENYKKLFTLKTALYSQNSPVIISAGALFLNTTKNQLHVQLKFQNIDNKKIKLLKAKITLQDSIGRNLEETHEKQYLDLSAKLNDYFGGNIAIFVKDNTARMFNACVEEVCFEDGSIWTNENNVWEALPQQAQLTEILSSPEAIAEYKYLHSEKSKYVPIKYNDLWLCSCGQANKESSNKCCSCGTSIQCFNDLVDETLKNKNIYRRACALIQKNNSADVKTGIALFEKIPDWKDSQDKINEANVSLEKTKHRENKKIILLSLLASFILIAIITSINIISSNVKADKYQRAQDLLTQHKYEEAMSLFSEIQGYENADNLYLYAKSMYTGDYKTIIISQNLTSFEIPNGVTTISNEAFKGCRSLTSITIPYSVTSIGWDAFYGCNNLTSIAIPNSVTSIGNYAFSDCTSLTSVTIPNSVTSIDHHMFYKCTSLTSITIPDSVTSIGDCAFEGCTNLTIYCEAKSKPSGWDYDWNESDIWNDSWCPVYWYSENEPTTSGNYWHYDENGEIEIWE